MEKVISKSSHNVLPIVICLVIGIGILVWPQSISPAWVGFIFLSGAIFFFGSIRTITIDANELTFKFIWQKKGRAIRKEDIQLIKQYKVGSTTAHRSGMLSKDNWVEIQGKKKRDIFVFTEKGEKNYHKIYQLLQEHYGHLFEEQTNSKTSV